MIHYFFLDTTGLHSCGVTASTSSSAPLWFDLLNPTADEIRSVEKQLSISIPTRDEMREIENAIRMLQLSDEETVNTSTYKDVARYL